MNPEQGEGEGPMSSSDPADTMRAHVGQPGGPPVTGTPTWTAERESALHKARYEALRSTVSGVRADLIIGVRNPFRRRAVMLKAQADLYSALYTNPPER